ncbi:MAG: hypothetical protein H7Z70_06755 [Bacteroidia bacterium]|nr:hypothetical protein [Methylotenera sp.]
MNQVKVLTILSLISVLSLAGCATEVTRPAQIDRITPEELAKIMPPPVAAVSLEMIVAQTKEGKTPENIIANIQASNSRYELTPSQTLMLSKQGVDVKVLDYIHQSNELAKQNAVADEINKREKTKRAELEKLKRQQLQQYQYDSFGGYGPYGFGPYGGYYGSRFGWGGGFYRPWGFR